MKRKSSSPPNIDGKHNFGGLELSEVDDLATLITVDSVLGFTTHKMDKNFNGALYDKRTRQKWAKIMNEFNSDPNYEETYNHLIETDKIKACHKKNEQFKRHIYRFLYLFDKRSGIEIKPCYRYENENKCGAGIFATKEWEKGSHINTLFGCIAEIHPRDEDYFRKHYNEFSVMYSTRKNCSQLWLGPAAYVNHDCKPNCRFTEGNDDTKILLETLRDIQPGDELLIYYGNNFFGLDNEECECFTCELRAKGMFNSHIQQHNTNSNNLRVTYSRIERLKKSILEQKMQSQQTRQILQKSMSNSSRKRKRDDAISDCKEVIMLGSSSESSCISSATNYHLRHNNNNNHNIKNNSESTTSSTIVTRSSSRLRNNSSNSHNHNHYNNYKQNILNSNLEQKLPPFKIKLKKNLYGCYDNLNQSHQSFERKNLFSQLNDLLPQQLSTSASSPTISDNCSDKPPNLSPWFHGEDAAPPIDFVKDLQEDLQQPDVDDDDEEEEDISSSKENQRSTIVLRRSTRHKSSQKSSSSRSLPLQKLLPPPPLILESIDLTATSCTTQHDTSTTVCTNQLCYEEQYISDDDDNETSSSPLLHQTPPHLICETIGVGLGGGTLTNTTTSSSSNCSPQIQNTQHNKYKLQHNSTTTTTSTQSTGIIMKISRINGNRFKSLLS